MFAAAFEKQSCRNVSKINSSSEAAIKMFFRYRCSVPVVKFFENFLWWSTIFSKFGHTAKVGPKTQEPELRTLGWDPKVES